MTCIQRLISKSSLLWYGVTYILVFVHTVLILLCILTFSTLHSVYPMHIQIRFFAPLCITPERKLSNSKTNPPRIHNPEWAEWVRTIISYQIQALTPNRNVVCSGSVSYEYKRWTGYHMQSLMKPAWSCCGFTKIKESIKTLSFWKSHLCSSNPTNTLNPRTPRSPPFPLLSPRSMYVCTIQVLYSYIPLVALSSRQRIYVSSSGNSW